MTGQLTASNAHSTPGDMKTNRTILVTIGYEATDLSDFVATLREARICCLIDIRELPMSRRKGFAKRALSRALARAGIKYVHLRGLGDPKEGRDAARAGDYVRFRRVFARHMMSATAQADLRKAAQLVAQGGACLMCYERDHAACHRSTVAKAISDILDVRISHLGVREGAGRLREQHEQFELDAERTA
jgi:uncharacterized protein (DUF488 family)